MNHDELLSMKKTFFKHPFKSAITALLVVGLAGCQSTPPPPPSDEQVIAFADQIEAAAIKDITIMNRCAELGGAIGAYSSAARESWHFANHRLLQQAEQLLSLQRSFTRSLEGQSFSLEAIARAHKLAAESQQQLNLAGRSPSGQKTVCRRELERIEVSDYSALAPSLELADLQSRTQAVTSSEATVADILTRWPHWPKPGRSYIGIFEQAKSQCAAQSRIITLKNKWPHEQYAVYCDTQPIELFTCEWNNCIPAD
jgi:hypothetical protein